MDEAPSTASGPSFAQRQVLLAVKRRGEASAEALAEDLGITGSGVRQHLAALKSGGLVACRQARGRPGRPANLYHSTELAEAYLAGASGDLVLEFLELIEEEDPRLVRRILDRRRGRRVERAKGRFSGEGFSEKVLTIVKLLDDEGYLAGFEELPDGTYLVTLHNCAIWSVASQYGHACTTELDFLRDVLPGAEIERVSHRVAGAYVCGYEIRPHPALSRMPLALHADPPGRTTAP